MFSYQEPTNMHKDALHIKVLLILGGTSREKIALEVDVAVWCACFSERSHPHIQANKTGIYFSHLPGL